MNASGQVSAINGNLIAVDFTGEIRQGEVALIHLNDARLKGEVVRSRESRAELQVFENTDGLRPGDLVEFTGELLSVQLGPGLLGQVYDGLQNPLPRLAEQCGYFMKRGVDIAGLEEEARWPFKPSLQAGDALEAGTELGTVPEGLILHRVMAPFYLRGRWRVRTIAGEGQFRVNDPIMEIENEHGTRRELTMTFLWPVRKAVRLYRERLPPTEPLITRIRFIDTLFPIALGGAYCTPGPFGAGKTVLQQLVSRYAELDVVIIAACGERASEVVETIRDYPDLTDPTTGRPLMERTIIICNTSAMPVAARESSVYTAATMAEYYRQMGLHVLVLADSTSRWAQAMRERSGRLEEIPGEEAFPAYLESTIADFYERAGRVLLKDGRTGSVTIGGTVSPAGGNFDEPVTQATLKVVGAFHGLSRERSESRRYPAIDPLDSWSRYDGIIETERRTRLRRFLVRAREVDQMIKVIGVEGTSLQDYILYLKGEFFDAVFLQQDAFDPVDAATPKQRQLLVYGLIEEILGSPLDLKTPVQAQDFFHQLRQRFLDLNGAEFDSPRFQERLQDARSLLKSRRLAERGVPGGLSGPALLESELDSETRRRAIMQLESRKELLFENEDGAELDE